ncbi:MAG: hypothetical protein A2Y12_19735 [Planctomycetes bacterium GWF2_42_9]|nr:MAG: hypothetical protein A2Y12_19735 [Planctomycetes bacterium GWF2_42_9]
MQFRFTYVVIALTAVLVFTVHIRTTSSRVFYKLGAANIKQTRFNQTLRQKQLDMERLISPAAISEKLRKNSSQE